ncbi:MAG TPA: hypothetical protein VKG26_10075, partial [Bacteroidia bacterium]|nr:hypothetical protein [Bacteroidia bacterium]
RKQLVQLRNYSLAFLFVLIAIFRSKSDSSSFISKTIFGENSSVIGVYLIFTTIILLLLFHFLSRRKEQIGKLILEVDTLTVQLKDKTLNFNIKEIKNFKIKKGFSDATKEVVTLISLYDNWLTFEYNNIKYEYQFTIESSYSSKQFADLLIIWKSNNTEFVVE